MHPVRGEGTINVGRPNLVHFSNLKQIPKGTPTIMNASDLEALMTEIGKSTHWERSYTPSNSQMSRKSLPWARLCEVD